MAKTYIADAVDVANDKAQYDAVVKRVLSDKNILAWIMKGTIKEFEGVPISQIMECIEGTPEVSIIPLEPGRTNAAITGDNTEDKVPNEGTVTFDIRFHAITLMQERIRLIINVEAQRKYYPGYDLVTRGIFYGARLISSQKDREFEGSHYDDIKKVYSIWICMNAPQYLQNTITEYSIQQNKKYGDFCGEARYDLMSVIMLCLGNSENKCDKTDDQAKLLRLLSVIASETMKSQQKLEVLQKEYHIEVTRELEEEVSGMCNWSEEIEERATARGMAKGMQQGLAQGMEQGLAQGMEQGLVQGMEQGLVQGMEQGITQGIAQGEILGTIGVYLELGWTDAAIVAKLIEKFSITVEEAEKYVQQKKTKEKE